MTEKGRDKAVRFLMNARTNYANFWYFPEVYVAGDAVFPVKRAAEEWAEQSFFIPAKVEVMTFEEAYRTHHGTEPSISTLQRVAFMISEDKDRRDALRKYELNIQNN